MGVKSPAVSKAMMSLRAFITDFTEEPELASLDWTVTGVQFIPSAEYAIVYPGLLFKVASSPKTFVKAAVEPPFHPPTKNLPPTASQITRVASLLFLKIAVAAAFA